uniref:Uncharacterized protein n=1 Tax=Haptolina brevifila TaxID=156173 RepID=A0A7S2DK04_9EUKA
MGDEKVRDAPRSRALPVLPLLWGGKTCATCWVGRGVGMRVALGRKVIPTVKHCHRPSQTFALAGAPSSFMGMHPVCHKRFYVGSTPPMCRVEVGSRRIKL